MATSPMDRRTFLTRATGTALLGLGGGALLAACGSSSKSSSGSSSGSSGTSGSSATTAGASSATTAGSASSTKSLGSASLQLDWIEDIEFGGSYIAKSNGYYSKAGLDVTLLAGGPSTAVEPIVVAGRALMGLSGPDITSAAINNGAKLTIVGAQMQKAPQAIMSLAKTPIKDPQDMIGKKIGVQAGNLTSFKAFLDINHIAESKVSIVPVQFDPSPLAAGTVDGWYSFITNEPFLLAAKGVKTFTWLMYDYGYRLYSGTYCVQTASLSDSKKRAQLVAMMKGEVEGWEKAFADPHYAAQLTTDTYGKANGLQLDTQYKELLAYEKIFKSSVTAAHGLFWMEPSQVDACVKTLGIAGIKSSSSYFTNEILEEVFDGKSSLALPA
jgi:ABC-type nitrate/sulfonate/bicarbonate transport system substrate-binding protein